MTLFASPVTVSSQEYAVQVEYNTSVLDLSVPGICFSYAHVHVVENETRN